MMKCFAVLCLVSCLALFLAPGSVNGGRSVPRLSKRSIRLTRKGRIPRLQFSRQARGSQPGTQSASTCTISQVTSRGLMLICPATHPLQIKMPGLCWNTAMVRACSMHIS
ncbi:hypothetical protein V8C86DRAFT_3131605, partial [Haematococcus lacustris]